MKPETLTLKTHQQFELEKTMRAVDSMPQDALISYLLEIVEQTMIKDNIIKYLFTNNDALMPPEVFSLTMEQQFTYHRMKGSNIKRSEAISLVEQALRILIVKTNLVKELLGKTSPILKP